MLSPTRTALFRSIALAMIGASSTGVFAQEELLIIGSREDARH